MLINEPLSIVVRFVWIRMHKPQSRINFFKKYFIYFDEKNLNKHKNKCCTNKFLIANYVKMILRDIMIYLVYDN